MEPKTGKFYGHHNLKTDLNKFAPNFMKLRKWTWPIFFAIVSGAYCGGIFTFAKFPAQVNVIVGSTVLVLGLLLQLPPYLRVRDISNDLDKPEI